MRPSGGGRRRGADELDVLAAGRARGLLGGHLGPLGARPGEARLGVLARHQGVEGDRVDMLLSLLLHL